MPNTSISSQQSREASDATQSAPLTTSTRSVLSTLAEMREHLLVVTRAAEHSLSIYTADLAAALYGQPPFLEALKYLVLARRYARVRILTSTTPDASTQTQALLSMAERLPSLMEVRTASAAVLGAAEFAIADGRALVYRIRNDRWDGMVDLNDPAVAKFYLGQFDSAWQAAHLDDEDLQTVGL
jgi:hypothetical protein